MFNFFQRIGLSFFKKTSGHRKIGRLFHSEPLEPRVLLAADTGIDVSRYALFYALSRGGDELMDHVGVNVSETTNSNVSAVVEFAPDLVGSDLPSDETELTTLSISEPIAAVPLEIETAAVDPVFEGEPNLSGNEFATQVGENQFVVYDPDSGEVRVELDEPGASTITTLEITSKTGIFTGAPALNLNLDQADVDTDVKLFKLGIGGFGSLTFGNVAATGLTEEFWANDLVISGSPLGGGQLSSEDISVQLSIEDTSGEDVDTLDIGDEFFLNIDVMDDRFGPQSMERAVFGAYLDVVFDGSQARVLDIEYADFDNGQSGTVSDGLIDEIGAFTLSSDGVSGSQTLARVRMKAIGAGTLDISSNAADITPQHNMLVFGSDDPVDLLRVDFGSDSVSIVDNSPTAPDLVQFAKDLTDSGTIFYGASWCPHCTDQKEAFDDGQEFLPFVEVTDYQNNATLATLNAIGIQENIGSFPTWEFPDGSRIEGNQDLQTLSNLSGVPIPQSNVPTLIGLENKDVLEGSPLHLPLDGWDPNGGELTYTISVDDPSVVSAELIEGSRSLLIDIESTTGGAPNFGQMLFYLFEDRAGRATDQIISLAEEGFYDGLTFHRIIDNFMMQGGDPLGTGSGSSDLPDFSDQFHPDLQHNMSGLLSMAKSADDTNNSQFFITDTTTRHLDFNHTIFGKLIEGDKNRDAATNAHVNGSTPEPTVTMRTVDVVDDLENSLMMLRAIGAVGSSTDVTVTVSDQEGHEFMETFTVTVADDTDPSANGNPFLEDIPELRTTINQPLNFNLAAIDVEDDPIFYYGEPNSSETETFDITVNENTGAVELTPPQDFAGILQVDFWVSANSLPERPSPFDFNPPPFDEQVSVEIFVEPAAPSVDLLAASDTGESDTDNITNADPLEFEVSGVVTGATVQLISIEFDGSRTEIGESSTPATDSTVTISTSNLIDDGFYEIVAVQSIDGMDSADSNTLDIEILREDIGDFTTTPPTDATVGELLLYDADHPLELTAEITYSLANAPGNVTISDDQGGLSWTPTPDQSGVHTFDIVAMDIAGNTATQTLTIDVQANTVIQVRLEVTDLGGNPIQEAIPLGDSFVLNAFVQDIRGQSPGGFGVDAAYIDVTFDDTLASFAGGLNFGANYPDNRTGDLSTNGLIDEAGASTSAALGQNEILLWSLELNSDADGTVAFTADIAETDPFGLVDFNDTITEDNIEFFGAEVVIVDMIFARSDTTTIDEDSGSVTINILDNDIPGPDNTTIVVTSTTDPSLGSVVIENQTTLLYTPDADANGEDSFTYQITGDVNTTETSTGTVTVNITPVNDAPVANPDTMLVMEDDIDAEIDVLANDDDVDGDDLTLTILTGPTNGSAEVSLDGSQLLYSPNADFVGSDTLTYQIEDPDGETSESTVTITVTTVNDPPNVGDDAVSTDEDTTLTIDASTLLSNDNPGPSNESSQNLTVISVENATNGTVSISGTEITFTPDADFNGTASFDYTVQDNGTSVGETDHRQASGSVTVTVNSVNDAPVAMDDTVETRQSAGTISIDVLANDSIGADTGETLTIELVGSTSNGGTATIVNNEIEYTPDSDFSGTETFTYTINDGNGLTATATVSVEVLSFVAGGVAGSVMFSNNAEQGISGSRIQLMGTDINGDAVDQTIQTGSDGSFLFDEVLPGTYTLTSNMPFTVNADGTSGPTSITVEVTDDGLGDQTLDFGSSILHPQFAIWEALASTTRDGLYAAVDTAGGYHWTRSLDGWDGTEIESVEFSSDMSTVTITINDATNGQMTATVDTSDHSQVQIIGQDGNDRLVRIVGSQSSFGFTAINGG